MATQTRKKTRRIIHDRIRKKIAGTTERPRLAVHFSNRRVYAQIIDDERGHTLASASTMEKTLSADKANVATATKIGEAIAERAIEKKVTNVVFDRAGHRYHGKVKALADAARAKGLKF